MFAESTSLHEEAVMALKADDRAFGLLEFEEHLLDRERPWAGSGGRTLKTLGYGSLGRYERHVKDHINRLIVLNHHKCVDDPLEAFLIVNASCTAAITKGCQHGLLSWSASESSSLIRRIPPGETKAKADRRSSRNPCRRRHWINSPLFSSSTHPTSLTRSWTG
jgi:hypothetical protein